MPNSFLKSLMVGSITLGASLTGACQTSSEQDSSAEMAKLFYEDGIDCYERGDFLCSLGMLEQVWFLGDYSKLDTNRWTYFTAQSNFMVAIDERIAYPLDDKIRSAERANALFELLGADLFFEERLALQYFLIKNVGNPCSERVREAIQRFDSLSEKTTDDPELAELQSSTRSLPGYATECPGEG